MADVTGINHLLGSGTKVSIETKGNKVVISIEVDEDRIAKAGIPAIIAQLQGLGDEKKEPAKEKGARKKREPKPGEPGYVSKETNDLPFGANADGAAKKEPAPAGAQ